MYETFWGLLLLLSIPFSLATVYRLHGGMKPELFWKLDELLVGTIIAMPLMFLDIKWYYIVAVIALTMLAKATGHGQWMNLRFMDDYKIKVGIKPERLDFIPKLIFGDDPRTLAGANKESVTKYGIKKLYRRCLFGLGVSNLFVGLPTAIGLIALGYWVLALVMLIGFFVVKPFAYEIGFRLLHDKFWDAFEDTTPPSELNEPTEVGEAVAGFLSGVFVSIALFFILFF